MQLCQCNASVTPSLSITNTFCSPSCMCDVNALNATDWRRRDRNSGGVNSLSSNEVKENHQFTPVKDLVLHFPTYMDSNRDRCQTCTSRGRTHSERLNKDLLQNSIHNWLNSLDSILYHNPLSVREGAEDHPGAGYASLFLWDNPSQPQARLQQPLTYSNLCQPEMV